jgi:hypothetical protein
MRKATVRAAQAWGRLVLTLWLLGIATSGAWAWGESIEIHNRDTYVQQNRD